MSRQYTPKRMRTCCSHEAVVVDDPVGWYRLVSRAQQELQLQNRPPKRDSLLHLLDSGLMLPSGERASSTRPRTIYMAILPSIIFVGSASLGGRAVYVLVTVSEVQFRSRCSTRYHPSNVFHLIQSLHSSRDPPYMNRISPKAPLWYSRAVAVCLELIWKLETWEGRNAPLHRILPTAPGLSPPASIHGFCYQKEELLRAECKSGADLTTTCGLTCGLVLLSKCV